MNLRGLFGLFLFMSATKGEPHLIGPSEPVLGLVGEDVILPCSLQPAESVAEATVEWTRPDLEDNNVLVFREGRDLYTDQNPSFQQRTSLFLHELKTGNMSLKLSRLQLSDDGNYTCKWIKSGSQTFIQVPLVIGAVSEPKIYAVSTEDSVVLQCKAMNWYPQPEMEWTDGKGNIISHDSNITKNGQYYSVHGTIKVEMTENVYTCTVRQQNINQSRETNYTVDNRVFNSLKNSVATLTGFLAVSIMLIVALITGTVAYIYGQRFSSVPQAADRDETDGITMQDLRDQLSQLQEMEREVNRLQAEVEMYRRENQALRRLGGRCHNTTNAEPQQPNSERRCSV